MATLLIQSFWFHSLGRANMQCILFEKKNFFNTKERKFPCLAVDIVSGNIISGYWTKRTQRLDHAL